MNTMMKAVMILAITFFSYETFATPFNPVHPNPVDKEAVLSAVKTIFDAFYARDAAGFASPMTSNVDFVNPMGAYIKGQQVVQNAHSEYFKQVGKTKGKYNWTNNSVRFIRPDIAIAVIQFDYSVPEINDKGSNTISFVVAKNAGKWEVELTQLTQQMNSEGHN